MESVAFQQINIEMYELTGTLKVIKEEQVISEKFKKREFVVTDESSQYPQHISFQATQDRCALLENFKEGDNVKVSFYLRGREWNSPGGEVKYFNSLDAWTIDKISGDASGDPGPEGNDELKSLSSSEEDFDDLPF